MKEVSRSVGTLLLLFALCFSLQGFASSESDDKADGAVSTKEEVGAYIQHHIKDSHDFHLFSYTNSTGERKHVGFPLPVIVWSSNGLATFMSSAFHHDDSGEVIVEKKLQIEKLQKFLFGSTYTSRTPPQIIRKVVRHANYEGATMCGPNQHAATAGCWRMF